MSLFGQSSAGGTPSGAASGGSSLFSGLNLDTSVRGDPSAKRKSIFEPSSTTQARSQSAMFGGGSAPSTSGASGFGQPATTSAASSLFGAAPTSGASTSGLFGQAGSNTTSTGGGLFGKPATSGPTTGAGLFGQSSTSTTSASTGLFGQAQSATSAPPTGGLFAQAPAPTASAPTGLFGQPQQTASAPSAEGGLFGQTGQSGATQQQQGAGLFGRPATTAAPSGGLFGNSSIRQAPPSLFGAPFNSAAGTSQQGASSGLLGTNAAQASTAATFATSAQTSTGLGQSQNREPAYFSSLLERQKKKARLNAQSSHLSQLPSVNMDLGDLARRAQERAGQIQKEGMSPSRDSRAHYLLSGSGVTPGKAYRDFQGLDGSGVSTAQQTMRNDFAEEGSAYLRGMEAKGREAMLRESMDRVYREVDEFIEQSLGIDLDEQKTRIMKHFGLIPDDDGTQADGPSKVAFGKSDKNSRSVFGRSAMEKSIIGNASSLAGTSSFFGNSASNPVSTLGKNQTIRDLRDKERLFVEKVEQLNRTRLETKNYPILKEFASVESTAGGDAPKQLIDAYAALQEITKENASDTGIEERHYVKAYLENDSTASSELKKQILEKSRTYLEKAFYRDLESIVAKNARAAQIGGMPTIINKVRAYIRVRAERHDLAPDGAELQQIGENGDYCWILIFYLLRSGFVKEAAEYVNTDSAFQSTDRRFVSYMTAYSNSPDRRLGRKLQEMIDGEYQQRAKLAPKGTVDPYRMACYKVIGRCDLTQRNLDSVGQGVEDWLWLQFSLARETDRFEELNTEIFGLDQICETITEIGQRHFQKSQIEGTNAYGTYFMMQILSGMFELAIDFLHSFNAVSAVHFAIALDYYGLLRVADYQVARNELLTFTTTNLPQINFIPLVAHYTGAFRAALPMPAVDYLCLICLNSDVKPSSIGNKFTQACYESLRELCLETREFAALLGDIRGDGSRIPGAIERRAKLILLDSHDAFLRSITSQSAAVADQRGQTADAVLLYHLCDDYDNATAVLNRALADAIAVDLGDAPMSLQPLKPRQATSPAPQQDQTSSLSLTQSTSSPVELARNMMNLYDSNAEYFSKISVSNRSTCKILLHMLNARAKIEGPNPEYLRALEELNSLHIIPLDTGGEIPAIRQMASGFGALPQLVARCAGLVILWCVKAIGGERDRLAKEGSWSAYGTEDDLYALRNQLSQMAKDLMVFAGLVKYKLPGRVYDMLTRAGGDVGGY